MSIRDQAAELLESADLFADEDRPVATVAELADAFDVPRAAVRSAAIDVGAQKVGASLALTESLALDCAEELSSRGFQIGDESDEEDDAEESACEDDACECVDHDLDDPDACEDDECQCVDHDDED
jgi:hypothetical protein